jgi:hypothetical protein
MNKSSALRAEDVAAPEDGRTPANSSQNVTMLGDSTTRFFPDFAGKKRFACGEQPEVFAGVIFGA